MFRKFLLMTVLALLVFPAAAMAQFKTGDYELTLSGSGTSDNDFDNNFITAQAGFGYFFSDMLEGLLRQEVSWADTEAGGSWAGSTALAANLNFNMQQTVPFLGASLGYLYGDDTEETWFAGPEGGIKAFVNNTTFVQALVQYQWFFDDAGEADNNFDDGRFVYNLGLGVKW